MASDAGGVGDYETARPVLLTERDRDFCLAHAEHVRDIWLESARRGTLRGVNTADYALGNAVWVDSLIARLTGDNDGQPQ